MLLADTTLAARTLLERALAVEDAFGRERTGESPPRAPSTSTSIVVGDRRSNSEDLVLPHPKASQRAFVLAPWHDLEPDAELLELGSVKGLLETLGSDGLTKRVDLTLDLQ